MTDLANFLLPNEPTCIVACSAGSARFWLSKKRFGTWQLLHEMSDKQAASRESDLSRDKPGRSFDIVGEGRHAMSQKLSGQQQQTMQFAQDVAHFLNAAINEKRVTRLVILAAPAVLGYLRSALSDTTLRSVALAHPINLANLEESRIKKYFE